MAFIGRYSLERLLSLWNELTIYMNKAKDVINTENETIATEKDTEQEEDELIDEDGTESYDEEENVANKRLTLSS